MSRPLRKYLILCEDKKSSRDYLASFPVDPAFVRVETVGCGMNTDSLVKEAIRLNGEAKKQGVSYAEIYCVFDRNSFPAANFNLALQLASKHCIGAIYSNECFEIWYLLHFAYRDTAISRQELYKELSRKTRLNRRYDKAKAPLFPELEKLIPTAIKHAESLLEHFGRAHNPERDNPSTNLHILVKKLLELKGAA